MGGFDVLILGLGCCWSYDIRRRSYCCSISIGCCWCRILPKAYLLLLMWHKLEGSAAFTTTAAPTEIVILFEALSFFASQCLSLSLSLGLCLCLFCVHPTTDSEHLLLPLSHTQTHTLKESIVGVIVFASGLKLHTECLDRQTNCCTFFELLKFYWLAGATK